MKKLFLGFLLPALASFAACDTEHDAERAAEAEAAADSGFRLAGTCGPSYDDNSCGGRSGGAGSCWCDALCSSYGDCCADYESFCDGDDPIPPATNLQGEGETCMGIAMLECEPGLVCGDVQVGVSDPAGVCMRPCGTIAGLVCDEGEYCDYDMCPEEVADAGGVCRPLGGPICTLEYAPVCGCDGVTYSNQCNAAGAGASIAHEGECAPVDECAADEDCDDGFCGWGEDNLSRVCKPWGEIGDSCGGFVLPSARNFCGPGLECDQSNNGDPTGDVPGVCAPASADECSTNDDCPEYCGWDADNNRVCKPWAAAGEQCGGFVAPEYRAECGPGLECEPSAVNPDFPGTCVVDFADAGEFCGGIAANLPQFQCDTGLTCVGVLGACAPGTADMGGTCIDVDAGAICPAIYAPVCGCDGQTYSNSCVANVQNGVGILAEGPCAPAGDSCQGNCGGQSDDGSCWCDAYCSYYGDCCSDKVAVCG